MSSVFVFDVLYMYFCFIWILFVHKSFPDSSDLSPSSLEYAPLPLFVRTVLGIPEIREGRNRPLPKRRKWPLFRVWQWQSALLSEEYPFLCT
jgi:hypothetical protein